MYVCNLCMYRTCVNYLLQGHLCPKNNLQGHLCPYKKHFLVCMFVISVCIERVNYLLPQVDPLTQYNGNMQMDNTYTYLLLHLLNVTILLTDLQRSLFSQILCWGIPYLGLWLFCFQWRYNRNSCLPRNAPNQKL